MARKLANWEKLIDWLNQVLTARTVEGNTDPWEPYEISRRLAPSRRTKAAVITYVNARNAVRFKRLRTDYQWLRNVMEEMGANPEDARFLL